MRKIKTLAALLLITISIAAQHSKLSPQTRSFLAEKSSKSTSTNKIKRTKSIGNVEYVSAYIHFVNEINLDILSEYGVMPNSSFEKSNIITAQIPVVKLEELSRLPQIKYIEIGTPMHYKMNNARIKSRVDKVHNAVAPLSQPYTGDGVIVGIVDGGFEYAHVNFQDTAGNLRVKRVWNHLDNEGTPPVGYSQGSEYITEAEIRAARYDGQDDAGGHATHVAGIAAGSDKNNGNKYYGIANEADLVFVSLDMASDALLVNSIDYIFDYADSQNKPCVINYSLGSHIGPHDGTSTFDVLADEMQGDGRIIVGAVGNEGADKLHISKVFDDSTDTLKTFVDFSNWNTYSYMGIWAKENTNMEFQVVVYDSRDGEIFESDVISTSDDTTVVLSYFGTNEISGDITIVAESASILNNKPNFFVEMDIDDMPWWGTHIGIKVVGSDTIHAWTDGYYSLFTDNREAGWQDGDTDCTVGEVGGVGKRMISAGAYVTNTRYGGSIGSIAYFSSRGPTADGRVKPDITAPGQVIISSLPADVRSSSEIAYTNTVNGKKYYYGYMQGTSQASPYVAGVLATWMEAYPQLSPEKVREVFQNTSIVDGITTANVPNNTYGNGKIDAFAGLVYLLGVSNVEKNNEDILVAYPNPTEGEFNIGFINDDSNVSVEVFNVSGQMVKSFSVDNISTGSTRTFNIADLANGAYMVNIKGNSTHHSFRIILNK